MNDLKKKVEAILFASGKYMSLEEISRLCKKDEQEVKQALLELTVDYKQDTDRSLVVLNDGSMWKLTTKEEYGSIVRQIVSETELTKSQIETLAVIAFKYPIKQSDLIKIRTNKAYDHISDLENAGFISRQKYGRSRLIKLTDKFYDYFDLPRDKLKERFKGFEQLASTIEHKEDEGEHLKEEQQKMAKEEKEEAEKERKIMNGEVDLIDDDGKEVELKTYEEEPEIKVEEDIEKLDGLEIIDTKEKAEESEEPGQDADEPSKVKQEVEESIDDIKEETEEKEESDEEPETKEDETQESVEESEPTEETIDESPETKEESEIENGNEETEESDEPKDLLDASH